MNTYKMDVGMTFKHGTASFISKARNGMCWPLGSERRHVIDGEVVGGGGPPAMFDNHRWNTNEPSYAAGMVKQGFFMHPDGYFLDPSCLPDEAMDVWPSLDTRGKTLLALELINGKDPAGAVAELPVPHEKTPKKQATLPPVEPLKCPVAGCGIVIEGETDPKVGAAALLVHQRLVHPGWQG